MDNIEKELKNLSGMIFHKNSEGKLHREDGPAVELPSGYKEWFLNGKLHRTDGPAIEDDYKKVWCQNGRLHREDGPAVEISSGHKYWWLDDKQYSKSDYDKLKGS